MAFRRFKPRRGTFNDYVTNLTGIENNELVYLTDRGGFAYLGDTVDYQYSYNDFITENVPNNACMIISDDNYQAHANQFDLYLIADYININGFYSGVDAPAAGYYFEPNTFNTLIQTNSFRPTGVNKITVGNPLKVQWFNFATSLGVVQQGETNGVQKIYFNVNSGVYLKINSDNGCKNLVGIYSRNDKFYPSGEFTISNSSGTKLLDLEHLPVVSCPRNTNIDAAIVNLAGPNYKLKTLTFENFNPDYRLAESNSSLTLDALSGLARVNLHGSLWWTTVVNNCSPYLIDLSGTSGYWKYCHNFFANNNYNLTGFNIPYSGVGYRPTGAADDDPYISVGGYFYFRKTNISASGLNDFYSKLVDLNGITVGSYQKGLSTIFVGGCAGTGQVGYDPTIATDKGWTINTA